MSLRHSARQSPNRSVRQIDTLFHFTGEQLLTARLGNVDIGVNYADAPAPTDPVATRIEWWFKFAKELLQPGEERSRTDLMAGQNLMAGQLGYDYDVIMTARAIETILSQVDELKRQLEPIDMKKVEQLRSFYRDLNNKRIDSSDLPEPETLGPYR